MTYRNEHEFNREWSGWLTAAGALVIPMVASQMQQAGLPDRYAAHSRLPGGSCWVEGKLDRRGLTTAQRLTMKGLCERGVAAVELKLLTAEGTLLVKAADGTVLVEELWAVPVREMSTDQARGHWLLACLAEAGGQMLENR